MILILTFSSLLSFLGWPARQYVELRLTSHLPDLGVRWMRTQKLDFTSKNEQNETENLSN